MNNKIEKSFWAGVPKTKLWKRIATVSVVVLLILIIPFGAISAKYGFNNAVSLISHGHFIQNQIKNSLPNTNGYVEGVTTSLNNNKQTNSSATNNPTPNENSSWWDSFKGLLSGDSSTNYNKSSWPTLTPTHTTTPTDTFYSTDIPQIEKCDQSIINDYESQKQTKQQDIDSINVSIADYDSQITDVKLQLNNLHETILERTRGTFTSQAQADRLEAYERSKLETKLNQLEQEKAPFTQKQSTLQNQYYSIYSQESDYKSTCDSF